MVEKLSPSIQTSFESVNEVLLSGTDPVCGSCSAWVCKYSELSSVEANLICCCCLSKNRHYVMTGLSHWLRGVSWAESGPPIRRVAMTTNQKILKPAVDCGIR